MLINSNEQHEINAGKYLNLDPLSAPRRNHRSHQREMNVTGYRSALLNSYHRERQSGQPERLCLSSSFAGSPFLSRASQPGVKLLMNISPKYQSAGIRHEGGWVYSSVHMSVYYRGLHSSSKFTVNVTPHTCVRSPDPGHARLSRVNSALLFFTRVHGHCYSPSFTVDIVRHVAPYANSHHT